MNCKILHVFYNYIPDKTGSSIRSRKLIRALYEYTDKSIVITTSPFQEPLVSGEDVELIDDVWVYRLFDNRKLSISEDYKGLFVRLRKFISIFYASKALREIIKKEKPDIIHAHGHFYCFYVSYLSSRFFKVRLVYEVRSLWQERFRHGSFSRRMQGRIIDIFEAIASKLSDKVICINHSLRDVVVSNYGVPYSKVSVIRNSIDSHYVDIAPRKHSRSDLIIGYVGNISCFEGLERFIYLIPRLKVFIEERFNLSLKFHIYGKGPEVSNLEKLIDKLNLRERIQFFGEFDHSNVDSIYSNIDIIINPRISSSLTNAVTPLKPLEALYFGKQILISNCGGMLELCDGLRGAYVCDFDDIYDVEKNLEVAVTSLINDVEGIFMRSIQSCVIKDRSWSQEIKVLDEIYNSLVSRG